LHIGTTFPLNGRARAEHFEVLQQWLTAQHCLLFLADQASGS
jgi:hypothetical protein